VKAKANANAKAVPGIGGALQASWENFVLSNRRVRFSN
jgi:hypothetical protein